MIVIEAGVDPDLKRESEFNVWFCEDRHRRCGTRVELIQEDVKAGVDGYWDRTSTYAYWTCPTCQRDERVALSRWQYPVWMREFKQWKSDQVQLKVYVPKG